MRNVCTPHRSEARESTAQHSAHPRCPIFIAVIRQTVDRETLGREAITSFEVFRCPPLLSNHFLCLLYVRDRCRRCVFVRGLGFENSWMGEGNFGSFRSGDGRFNEGSSAGWSRSGLGKDRLFWVRWGSSRGSRV